MSRIWFISAPLFSHTDWGGFLKTARVLQAQGETVTWVSTERLRSVIEQVGLPFLSIPDTGFLWPLPPAPDVTTLSPQEAVTLRYRRALDTWLSEDRVLVAARAMLDLAQEQGAPDLIVSDPFLAAAALAAEALNVPLVIAGWPAQGDLNADSLFPVQRQLGSDSEGRLQRLCDALGVKGDNFSRGPTPSIVSPLLHINYFTADWYAAESATMLPQNRFVGGRADAPKQPAPDWLIRIPEHVPLAVITLGTTFTGDLGFFGWAAQAAAREGLLPIVTIGGNPFNADEKQALIRALPKGSHLLNWVPFDHVLPRTRLMIHHGGMGTTHYAIVHGIPQIVVPHAADQRVQAKRVAQARVGLNLTAHDVRQGQLTEGVRALMTYGPAHEAAAALAARMAALGGPEAAAAAIIRLV